MTQSVLSSEFVDKIAQAVRLNNPYSSSDTPQKQLDKASLKRFNKMLADYGIDSVYDALITIKNNIESQLSAQKARDVNAYVKIYDANSKRGDFEYHWNKYKSDRADWRARATRFLSNIELHIMAVKAERRSSTSDQDLVEPVPTPAMSVYEMLKK